MSLQWLINSLPVEPRVHVSSILLTRKCNFKCASCVTESGPGCSGHMAVEDLERYLVEVAGSCRAVSFSGGESTLFPEELELGIKKAQALGLRTGLVTNAWWAEDKKKAQEFVSYLRATGLREFNFSFDEFHAPYLSLSAVRNVLESVAKVDFDIVTMMFVMHNDTKSRAFLDTLLREIKLFSDPRLIKMINDGRLMIFLTLISPSGRASGLIHKNYLSEHDALSGCHHVLYNVILAPDGDIMACCGGVMENPYLRLGNLREESFSSILGRAYDNLFLRLIYYEGPIGIIRFINKLEPQWRIPKRFVNSCQACSLLLGPKGRQFLHKYYPELSYYIDKRIDNIKKIYNLKINIASTCHTKCILCEEDVAPDILLCSSCDNIVRSRPGSVDFDRDLLQMQQDKSVLLTILLKAIKNHLDKGGGVGKEPVELFIKMLSDFYLDSKENREQFKKSDRDFKRLYEGQFDENELYISLDHDMSRQFKKLRNKKNYFFENAVSSMLKLMEEVREKGNVSAGKYLKNIIDKIYKTYHYETKEILLFRDSIKNDSTYCRSPFIFRIMQKYGSLIQGMPANMNTYVSEVCLDCGCRIGAGKLLCQKCWKKNIPEKIGVCGVPNPAGRVMKTHASDLFLRMESYLRDILHQWRKGKLNQTTLNAMHESIEALREGIFNNIRDLKIMEIDLHDVKNRELKRQYDTKIASETALLSFVDAIKSAPMEDLRHIILKASAWLDAYEGLRQESCKAYCALEKEILGDVMMLAQSR